MSSRKQKVLMAGVLLAAAASAFGAHAADQSSFFDRQRELTDGNPGEYLPAPTKSTTAPIAKRVSTKVAVSPKAESRNFEYFENQLQLTDGEAAKTVTPSEIVK
jgi:hypothetical protein